MDNSAVNIWKKVVDNLTLSIGQAKIDLWFRNVNALSFSDNILTLSVPNRYFSDEIEKKYKQTIEQMLSAECSADVKIQFNIKEDLSELERKIVSVPIHTDRKITFKDQINPDLTFEGFVVGNSNRFASGCAQAVVQNPGKQFNPLFIYGGSGLGKTHLLHAIGNGLKKQYPNYQMLYVTCETFVTDFIESLKSAERLPEFKNKYRNLDCLFIDDIQFLVNKDSSQEEFFNIFNVLKDNNKQIVIASDRPQSKLEIEERLISRFKWGNTVDIQPPDLETRIAILRKKAEKEQVSVPDDVILFLAKHIKSNVRELEGILLKVTSFIKFTGTPFTLEAVKNLLKDVINPDEDHIVTIDTIQKVVSEEYRITVKDLKGKKRSASIVIPRQIAIYLARTMTNTSTTEIGDAFGGKDHTTVMHACNKIKEKIESDPFFVPQINKLMNLIKNHED